MSSEFAAVVCALGIVGLFWLDRDRNHETSGALWIPVVWLLLACSRSVAQWLNPLDPMKAIYSTGDLLEGSPLDRQIYTALLALGLIVLFRRRRQVTILLRENKAILAFLLYCAVSVLWSDYPGVALKRWIKVVGDFAMVLIVLTDCDYYAAVNQLLARITYVLIPLSILFIKYYPEIGRVYGRWDGTLYCTGVTTNKNSLGAICLLFGIGSMWRFLAIYRGWEDITHRSRRLLVQSVILAMILWLFWVAHSMTSLASFLLVAALLWMASLAAIVRRTAVLSLCLAGVIIVPAVVLFIGVSPGLLEMLGRDPTLTGRTDMWNLLLGLAANPLIGTGYDSFWLGPRLDKIWSVFSWGPNEAHNGYLEMFLNLGWTGVALLTVVIAHGYRTVFADLRRRLPLANLMLAYFALGLIYNLTEAAFFRIMTPVSIFFVLAITSVPDATYFVSQTSPQVRAQLHDDELLLTEVARAE